MNHSLRFQAYVLKMGCGNIEIYGNSYFYWFPLVHWLDSPSSTTTLTAQSVDSQGPVPLQVEPLLGLKKKSINANVVNVLNLTMFKSMFFLIIQKKISKTDKVTLGAEIAFLVTKLQLMTRRVRWILWLLQVLITEVEEIF